MARTTQMEINDLAVRLMDGGLPERSAHIEAKRIADVIHRNGYDLGYADAKRKVLDALTGKEA
ncbi:hypothetical protein [Streptomyces sp. NPDC002088]|uniref:hypothetical protein n=1 Tax=Streptomyces sp. NPDC002088 TaxID=3154665 RepID=UPI00331E370D